MIIVLFIIYVSLLYGLLNYVDIEFEFVRIPTEITWLEIIFRITIMGGITAMIHVLGVFLIRAVLIY